MATQTTDNIAAAPVTEPAAVPEVGISPGLTGKEAPQTPTLVQHHQTFLSMKKELHDIKATAVKDHNAFMHKMDSMIKHLEDKLEHAFHHHNATAGEDGKKAAAK